MGAYYGKITGNVESDSDSRDDSVADDDNSLGKETTGRTTAVSQSFSEKLKDWRSVVTGRVNDLYEDGKHAFSFSPHQKQDGTESGSSQQDYVLDVNKRQPDGQTLLTYSIRHNDVSAVQTILSNSEVDVNFPEKQLYGGYRWDFYPPLIVAVLSETVEMVRLLLLSGASINSHDSLGFSALYHASKLGNAEMVALLLNYNPNIPEPSSSSTDEITNPLQVACYYGHTEVAKLLIESGCKVNVDDDITPSPLNLALDKEDEDICLILLRHGAYYYKTLFFKACQYGCEKVVRHMLQLGTNINSLSQHQETALMFSLNPGSSNRLRRKLAYTTDKDTSTSEAYVVLQRTVKLIHLLSENGCNLEIKDSLCNLTVLQRSMQSHNLPAVIALLKHGAYFTLDDACLHIEYITDQVFNDLSDLYKMFTFYSIPNYIQRKWKWRRSLEQPSTLQHICRITIRERLKSCRRNLTTLLPRIEKLELPRQLKDFLSYKEIDEMDAIYCDKFFDIRWCIS